MSSTPGGRSPTMRCAASIQTVVSQRVSPERPDPQHERHTDPTPSDPPRPQYNPPGVEPALSVAKRGEGHPQTLIQLSWPWAKISAALFVSILPIFLESLFHIAQDRPLLELVSPATTLYSLFAVAAVSLAEIIDSKVNSSWWILPCLAMIACGIFAVVIGSGPYPQNSQSIIFAIAFISASASVYAAWCPYSISDRLRKGTAIRGESGNDSEDGEEAVKNESN